MKLGFIGLGKMGANMVSALLEKKHKVVVFDLNKKAVKNLVSKGAIASENLSNLCDKLKKPRIIWLMVPHGKIVDSVLKQLIPNLSRGDIIIDGGNSHYTNTLKRAIMLKRKGIHLIDAGVSGGLSGARNGASIMVGGNPNAYKKVEVIFKSLAIKNGYGYMGQSGSGHFVKMVHNGIEYSLLQSYAEGYQLIEKSKFKSDLREVTKVWRHGSVIRSWLLDLMANALKKDPKLNKISGVIGGGSTGQWTIQAAKIIKSPVPTVVHALNARKKSQKKQSFASKVVAVLRLGFGGHIPPKQKKKTKIKR